MDINKLLQVLLGLVKSEIIDKPENDEKCPKCGASIKDISKNKKIGCVKCYEHFELPIMAVIKKNQGSLNHVGKTPKTHNQIPQTINEYIEKQKLLMTEAAEKEDYESASRIKEKIQKINNLCLELDVLVSKEQFEEALVVRKKIYGMMVSFESKNS